MKKKILLVADVKEWAFDNIAQHIAKELENDFDFKIIYSSDVPSIIDILLIAKNFDLVHIFWRGLISEIDIEESEDLLNSFNTSLKTFKKYIKNIKITTSVYDHMYLKASEIKLMEKVYNTYTVGYTTSSQKLFDIYNNIEIYKKPNMVITDGIDLAKFKSKDLNKINTNNNEKLIIGWVGNSAWGEKKDDVKGVNTILKPAIKELINEGYKIEEYFADKQSNPISFDKMPEYYKNIDVYVCSSSTEGTPNPVLEAMATGTAIISTDVGIVSDILGNKQKEFILKERSISELKEKIIEIYNNRKLLKILGEENLQFIKKKSWKNICQEFKQFFENYLK